MRETTPAAILRLTVAAGCEHAVDPEQHAGVALLGVHVDVGGALLDRLRDDRVDELDDRGVAVGLVDEQARAPSSRLGLLIGEVFDRLVHAREARGAAG